MRDGETRAVSNSHFFTTIVWLMERQITQIGSKMVCGSGVKNPVVGVVRSSCHISTRLPWCRGRVSVASLLRHLRATPRAMTIDTCLDTHVIVALGVVRTAAVGTMSYHCCDCSSDHGSCCCGSCCSEGGTEPHSQRSGVRHQT